MVLQSSKFARLIRVGIAILFLFILRIAMVKSYKRCASDSILIVSEKGSGGEYDKYINDGGTLKLPVIQDYQFLDLMPIFIEVNLVDAFSKQNIRVNVP